jgi:hypothetical protein
LREAARGDGEVIEETHASQEDKTCCASPR